MRKLTEEESEIENHRSRLIENLPHLSHDVLRSTFGELLNDDYGVLLIAEIMPLEKISINQKLAIDFDNGTFRRGTELNDKEKKV